MTELLFQKDSYTKEFEAIIEQVVENGIILDKTAFSYRGGGLQSDTGIIISSKGDEFIVKEVISKSGKVIHILSPSAPEEMKGENIKCKIDWENRYRQMRMHTTLHIISSILYKKYGSSVTGGNVTPERSRVDFEIDHLRQERVQEIAVEIERIIKEDRPISISFMKREEANKHPELIRTKVNLIPESVTVIRVVEIENVDVQADGGVHVAKTGEIGKFIPLKSENRGKNNKRLYFTLGSS